MNEDFEDLLDMSEAKPKKEADAELIKALEQRHIASTNKRSNISPYDLQVTAEDIFVKKELKEMRCEMPGTPRSTFLMVFSPDGTKVASTHGNHNIHVTDIRSGKNIKTLVGHPRTPWCIAFHPTSNQILASGCLGGQVRIWDLSGGSEVWTADTQTVIASIAFHPDDRLLVIATYNELYFWDWSKPEPFMHVSTNSIKEKVRYVAFDKLGHKLITGIANSPQTRWERVRAPVPVPRQVDRAASPYRRRITPRLISNNQISPPLQSPQRSTNREPLSTVPERERRITACYRNLVREYELLVHRYLQLYRPPTMIDQGTDPMELDLNSTSRNNQSSEPSTSGLQNLSFSSVGNSLLSASTPSTSGMQNQSSKSPVRRSSDLRKTSSSTGIQTGSPLKKTTPLNSSSGNASPSAQCSTCDLTHLPSPVSISISSSTGQQHFTTEASATSRRLSSTYSFNPQSSISAPQAFESPTLPRDMVRLTPSEICTLRRSVKNYRSTQTHDTNRNQDGEGDGNSNVPSTSGIQNRNERRNSAPAGTVQNTIAQKLRKGESNEQLLPQQQSTSVRHYVNVVNTNSGNNSKVLVVKSSNNNNSEQNSTANGSKLVVIKSSSANSSPSTTTTTQTTQNPRRLLIISTSLGTQTVNNNDNQQLEENSDDNNFKMRIKCSPNSKNTKTDELDNQPSTSGTTNSGPKKNNLNILLQNAEKLFSKCFVSPSSAKKDDDDKSSPESNTETAPDANRTDNSGASERPEQTRKRAYPGFSKKPTRRSVLDSSSNSSSSDEGEQSKRHIPSNSYFASNSNSVDTPPTSETNNNNNNSSTSSSRRPLNFNTELEMLVTDLLANNNDSASNSLTATNSNGMCGTCGGSLISRNPVFLNTSRCARTDGGECHRRLNPSGRRFFSAFSPIRMEHRRHILLMRHTLRSLGLPETSDEIINYSERENSEEEIPETSAAAEFHPFDPPPEFAAINPENIGIGNMYSNIVQELESSLNDVRNIRASNRLGETSDMLSSFSERLESIMNQSNSILRNLRTSIDTLTPAGVNYESRQQQPAATTEPQLLFNDRNFYVREQGQPNNFENSDVNDLIEDSNTQDELFPNHNAVAVDHTYPLNSRNSQNSNNIMTPLMVSLHLTVSHIQRQARLLRQQVESIERIDRAMLEVAQLQLLRQLFADMQRYIRVNITVETRSTVSSVRQMMAGTRISDSSPYDSPSEELSTTENQHAPSEAGPSTSTPSSMSDNQNSPNRTQNRKTFPRCIFLMHRNLRRGNNLSRRCCAPRERISHRRIYRRAFTCRSLIPRTPVDLSANRSMPNLHTISRRLELFLMEHGRNIGRVSELTTSGSPPTDRDEYALSLRLNHCRARVNMLMGYDEDVGANFRRRNNNVTADGSSRYDARDMLVSAAYNLCIYLSNGVPGTASLRVLIWDVIDLSVLLTEILLLQIVDSIPPPTGMNLDPERESLSTRIDQMCSRILQSRLSGHSQQLTRSLRLTRIAVRQASRALDQTYTDRRNAMMPLGNEQDQRREILTEISTRLRNIRRNHMIPPPSTSPGETTPDNLAMREWFRTISGHISQSLINEEQPSTSSVNAETGEQVERPLGEVSSDDDTEPDWYNNNVSRERARPLYRTNNVNLLNNEESTSSRNRPWNVPTVHVNDVPISQYQSQWQQRFSATRQRISERFAELRAYTVGGLFRPRFLHPLYAGANNPFDAELEDSTREHIYDSDIIAAVSPHHRIQVWEFSSGNIPNINNALLNVVVNECRIHNDASVAIATDGSILVALLPSGGYINIANRLGIYSLEWESLGQCLYVATFEQNAVSVSLSPLSRHLVVGLTSRRVSIIPSDKWTMARIFKLEDKQAPYTQLSSVRDVEQSRDPNFISVNCIRWLPVSGQGLIYGTNTGQLRVLT